MPRRRPLVIPPPVAPPITALADALATGLHPHGTLRDATTTGRIRTRPAPPATPAPPPVPEVIPAAPVVPAWSMSRAKGKMVLTVKREDEHPVHLYLTAREAVKLASHLLANAGGLMDEEELNRPPRRG